MNAQQMDAIERELPGRNNRGRRIMTWTDNTSEIMEGGMRKAAECMYAGRGYYYSPFKDK